MDEQADRREVLIRCRACEHRRPGYGTALLRMVPVPGPGRWQVYRLERVAAPREPIRLGINWELGDPRFGLAADEDGTMPAPWVLPIFIRDPPRCMQVSCRGCGQVLSVWAKTVADRAEAQGKQDAYAWPRPPGSRLPGA